MAQNVREAGNVFSHTVICTGEKVTEIMRKYLIAAYAGVLAD